MDDLTYETEYDYSDASSLQVVFNADHVCSQICFENTHDIAQYLAVDNPTVATALLDELLYWRSVGRI